MIDNPFIIKGISEARYFIIEYIKISFLLPKKFDISKLIFAKIIINIYLVNNLRVNILIKIDTIGPKKINIITMKRYVYIISYNI